MQGVIRLHFGLLISESALAKHIDKKLNVTYKLIKVMKPGNNIESTKAKRKEYFECLMDVDDYKYNNHFVFIDESGFQPSSFKKRGWAVRGSTPNVIGRPRTKRINVIGAISGQGTALLETQVPQHKNDNFTSAKFMGFMIRLQKILIDYCNNNNVDYDRINLVLDNCRIHGTVQVKYTARSHP